MGKAIFLRGERADTWIFPIAFGVAIAGVYWAAWPGAWLYDDALAIVRNTSLHEAATAFFPPANGSPVAGRPLLNASFAVDWAVGGARPGVYLATNLFIHWLAVCTLWGVLRRTWGGAPSAVRGIAVPGGHGQPPFGRRPLRKAAGCRFHLLSFAIALAWAVHPLGTSAVAYVSQRAESLAGLACLFALYALARGWRVAAVVACAAGMAVKETMVAAPLILWLYDAAFLAPSPQSALRRRPGFYLGLAATWGLLAVLVLHEGSRNGTAGFGSGVSALRYAALQGAAILHYLRLAAWPHPLVFLYPRTLALSPWDGVADVVCLGLLAASVTAYARGPRGAGFLGLAFFLWLAPSSSLVPISTEIRSEHRMYLPLAAVLTLVAAALFRWAAGQPADPREPASREGRRSSDLARTAGALRRRFWFAHPWTSATGAAVIVVWAIMGAVRARDYSDPVRLWAQNARVSPANPWVWNNLGTTSLDAGDAAGSLTDFDRAIALMPDYAEAHLNRGLALVALGRMAEAADEFEAALRISPGYDKARRNASQAWLLLGNRAAQSGRTDEALRDFTRSVAANPADPYAENNLGLALRRLGRIDEAIAHYRRALELKPDFLQARTNLNVALATQLRTLRN